MWAALRAAVALCCAPALASAPNLAVVWESDEFIANMRASLTTTWELVPLTHETPAATLARATAAVGEVPLQLLGQMPALRLYQSLGYASPRTPEPTTSAPLPATGVPAELVRRRPDLLRAYYQLQAADADLASAVAERFPRLTLSASLSNETTDSEALFDDWLATLAGNLVLPLIDGGQRRAEARRFRSLREQRLYEYGQATLVAFREVEDALIQERQQQRRMESLREQLELADSAYRQLRIQYVNGAVGYLEVLSALQERQELRRTLITARQELLAFRVSLYRALAGGFPVPEEEENA